MWGGDPDRQVIRVKRTRQISPFEKVLEPRRRSTHDLALIACQCSALTDRQLVRTAGELLQKTQVRTTCGSYRVGMGRMFLGNVSAVPPWREAASVCIYTTLYSAAYRLKSMGLA